MGMRSGRMSYTESGWLNGRLMIRAWQETSFSRVDGSQRLQTSGWAAVQGGGGAVSRYQSGLLKSVTAGVPG